jgi:periplasmic mercuric ion binding protein
MIRHVASAMALALMLSPWTARAAERTVLLNVDNATCELCGPIVKKTLARVWGVKVVQIAEAKADTGAVATVMFDDGVTNVTTLISAVTNAGYPARVRN